MCVALLFQNFLQFSQAIHAAVFLPNRLCQHLIVAQLGHLILFSSSTWEEPATTIIRSYGMTGVIRSTVAWIMVFWPEMLRSCFGRFLLL